MAGKSWAADWEHVVGRDLVPHLVPAGHEHDVRRPAGLAEVPDGALAALYASVGDVGEGGFLIIPAAAWQWQRWRRRSLYTPLSVAGVGERGVGLWVRALPVPGVRIRIPFDEMAAVEQQAVGPWRVLAVTGGTGRILVRYREDRQSRADGWVHHLRDRAGLLARDDDRCGDEELASASWRSGLRRTRCLAAVTSREVIIEHPVPGRGLWRYSLGERAVRRTLFVPRRSLRSVTAHGSCVRLRSAGIDIDVELWSARAALSLSSWLRQACDT